jgi:phage/plasmid-associated DNA primase
MTEHNEDIQVVLYGGEKRPKKADAVAFMSELVTICNYYGQTYAENNGLWNKITEKEFKSTCYAVFGAGIPSAAVRDLEHYFIGSHNILPTPSKLISFGGLVWDMDKCDFVTKSTKDCFFRSSVVPNMKVKLGNNQFVKDLACNDEGIYADIFTTLSVIFSSQKPDMVGFFFGEGRNGKSVLVDVINKIIGNHISSINLERLTDQRDAPLINGTLANLCGENADNIIIEDSQTYKSIGSHERWSVHRMHTNDSIEIDTNPLHIFCVNNLPTFKDKSESIIRRARIVPFNNKFIENRQFRDDLLNNDIFLSDMLGELLLYCQDGKKNNWVSHNSVSTQKQIDDYDVLRNSAKTFVEESINDGLVGFQNFIILGQKYENWCKDNGYIELGVKNFRQAVMKHPFERKNDPSGNKIYMLTEATPAQSQYKVGIYYQYDGIPNPIDDSNVVTQDVLDLF